MNPAMERLALADIEEALIGCDEFLEKYVDVVDGPYGQPAPNAAMSLQAQVREAMQKLDRMYALKAPMPAAQPIDHEAPDLQTALQDLLPYAMGYLDYVCSLKPAQREAAREFVKAYNHMPRTKAFVATDAVRNAKAALDRAISARKAQA